MYFRNCIFLDDVAIFGDLDDVLSFEGSTFINSQINIDECNIEHLVMGLTTYNNSILSLQQTRIYSSNVYFGNIHLFNSIINFANTVFSKSADLLDLSSIEADKTSHLSFRLVDFYFSEIRLFASNFTKLIFVDCTFNCNRFEFECSCETLILQNCKNFKVISINDLKNLKCLNVLDFVNTGKVMINSTPEFYIDKIKTLNEIIWRNGAY